MTEYEEDRQFRDHVVGGLAELHTQNTAILGALNKMNGSVGQLSSRVLKLETEHAARMASCPFRDDIGAVELGLKGVSASRKTSAYYLEALKPLAWLIGGSILLLVLTHADPFLKWFAK